MAMNDHHYIDYDPQLVLRIIQMAYIEAGGDVAYPGDEKDMLMRGMQSAIVQALAAVDNALLQNTLSNAVDTALDLYGEKRGCYRIDASPSHAVVEVEFMPVGQISVIPAGALLTVDGAVLFSTDNPITISPLSSTMRTSITCTQAGVIGNGIPDGTVMQFVSSQPDVKRVTVITPSSGGEMRETDDSFRERIRTYGAVTVTTGPVQQYEGQAKAVSTEILDASAVNGGPGVVDIYLLGITGDVSEELRQKVEDSLSAETTRPLTDHVVIHQAEAVHYSLNVKYTADNNADTAIRQAAYDYKSWQDNTIGQAFNPDRLVAAMYQAGATRVIIDSSSSFDGGAAEYTPIAKSQYCSGEVSLAVII